MPGGQHTNDYRSWAICNALVALLCAVARPSLAQLQPFPGASPVIVPPANAGSPVVGGACGVHQVNDPNFIPIGVTAQPTTSFSILITVSAPVGSYTITSDGLQDTVVVRQSIGPATAARIGSG